jgi:hypothetical protein
MVGKVTFEQKELLAVIYAIQLAPSEIRKNIRQYTSSELKPSWMAEIREHAASGPRASLAVRAIAQSAKVRVSDRQIEITGASSNRKATSGGLIPSRYGTAVEFGSNGRKKKDYMSSRKGTAYKITGRVVNAQLTPRTPKGSAFWPAATDMQPRAAKLWVSTTVRTIMDALEGKK